MKRVIGVTGGIASGKSNVGNVLKNMGYTVIDSDKISFDLSLKGQPLYEAILESFGKEYLKDDGEIDRKKLGRLIFNDPKKKELLNQVTHPVILKEMKREIEEATGDLVFIEVPLLYEAHMETLCDKVICIYLTEDLQVSRLMEREHIDKAYALRKIHSQMDLNEKKNRADYIINSKGTFDETECQVKEIINQIKGV